MDNLPMVIPTALIHTINTLERDSNHQLVEISPGICKKSPFVKCKNRVKTVVCDKDKANPCDAEAINQR